MSSNDLWLTINKSNVNPNITMMLIRNGNMINSTTAKRSLKHLSKDKLVCGNYGY